MGKSNGGSGLAKRNVKMQEGSHNCVPLYLYVLSLSNTVEKFVHTK